MIILIEPFKDKVNVSYPESTYSDSISNQYVCDKLISSMLQTSEIFNGDAVFHVDAGFNTKEVISFVESCNVPNTFAIKYQSGGSDKVVACSKPNSLYLNQVEIDKNNSITERINALATALYILGNQRSVASTAKESPVNKAIDDIAKELSKLITQD